MMGARFTREGQGDDSSGKESSTSEVWLSLWEGGEMEGCAALQRGGTFWVGSGDGCEIRLGDKDIGRKHTGIRVDGEGIVWITDFGGWGGTRLSGEKLVPHMEKRLRGTDFWCGRNNRHFKVTRAIPSSEYDTSGNKGMVEARAERGQGKSSETAGEQKRNTAALGEITAGPPAEGVEIWFDGAMERGHVNDFVVVWKDRGAVHHYLLRDGDTCWLGESKEGGIVWSGSFGWEGSLVAADGLLSLKTDRPALVRGLEEAEGVGSSSAPATFHIRSSSFMVLGTEFYCNRVCFSSDRGFFYGVSGTRVGECSTVQRTEIWTGNKLGKRGVEQGIT